MRFYMFSLWFNGILYGFIVIQWDLMGFYMILYDFIVI